ncbi:flippase activity-associated protein Agl23 [Halobium salinum]|uniref:Flippase activity-associated protein Agl23 n=1 Tax=Halobium salinum TaxID=1364940 RepID=A0ABD5P647_9EURY|nr:flippase activity-associated protein Agl23 [Halobium salinum]
MESDTLRHRLRRDWLWGVLLLVAVVLRFHALEARPVHWDEGVHAYFAWEFLTTGQFTYEPWRHGPFLYYAGSVAMAVFGERVVVGRAVVAAVSLGSVVAAYALRDELPMPTAAVAGALLAVHPYVLAPARFFRNDAMTATFTLLAVALYVHYRKTPSRGLAAGLGAALALAIATKEVSYFVLPAAFAPVAVVAHFEARFTDASWRAVLYRALPPTYLHYTVGVAVAVLAVLYGGWPPDPLAAPGAIVDGFQYWRSVAADGNGGKPMYYLGMLTDHTPVLFALALVGCAGTVLDRDGPSVRWLFLSWLALPAMLMSLASEQAWWSFVHLFTPFVFLVAFGVADLRDALQFAVGTVRDRLAARPGRTRGVARLDGPGGLGAATRRVRTGAGPTALGVVLAVLLVTSSVAAFGLPGGVERMAPGDGTDADAETFRYVADEAARLDCPVQLGKGVNPWPAPWWLRGLSIHGSQGKLTADWQFSQGPAVLVTGEEVTPPKRHEFRVVERNGYYVYLPRSGC